MAWEPDVEFEELWERLRTMSLERYTGFETLIRFRVRKVLLVASLYDAFTLEEGGRLTELLLSEYRELNLSEAPHLTRATSGVEALELIEAQPFDLVLTMTRIGDMDTIQMAHRAKAMRPDLPVFVLGYNVRELERITALPECPIDRVFIWTGDVRILIAIIKQVEDQRNVEWDTRHGDVRTVLLIEDSVRFYSSYLPLVYTAVMGQTHELMASGINLSQKLLRMRARPKILFATTFEEAWSLYDTYRDYMLGVISDARFPWGGQHREDAGVEFIRRLKDDDPHMPAVIQSSDPAVAAASGSVDAEFIRKDSPSLLHDLEDFMREHFGFGDFVFRMPDGDEIGRAQDLGSMARMLERIPDLSLQHHAAQDHFSNWLRARTEFTLAKLIKPRKASEFANSVEMRNYLVESFRWYRKELRRGVVYDFSPRNFESGSFARIGTGSLGGKARGLAFMNHIIDRYGIRERFENMDIGVPPTAVVATDVFDAFLDQNDLRRKVIAADNDQEVIDACLAAKLPPEIYDDLEFFLDEVRYPLAVRSSSLLEDAQCQPFAGVYNTYMLANNHDDVKVRLDQLCDAIKLVYASTFLQSAKAYLKATANRVEAEKMAVIIQQVVGRRHDKYVYPDFAGVAHSTNHYASGELKPEDGVALVALGLGRTVVEGGKSLRFSPRHPQRLPQFATIKDTLDTSQRQFQAIDVSDPEAYPRPREEDNVVTLDLAAAEAHGTLDAVGSVYSSENGAIYDGIHRDGVRLVTFAHVLKSGVFPLPEVLTFLLELGCRCMNCAVEMEFAVSIDPGDGQDTFGLLQIRPLAAEHETPKLNPDLCVPENTVISTEVSLGNGRYAGIRDVVYVPRGRFDRSRTTAIAEEVGRFNTLLSGQEQPYLLVGPGRWGSADRWLGIPVQYTQIAGAAVIIETDLDDFKVTPSQGTHFFQNLTSFQVGYLTVNQASGGGYIDWDWLDSQPVAAETKHLRHVRLEKPLTVLIDGRSGRAAVFKPEAQLPAAVPDEVRR